MAASRVGSHSKGRHGNLPAVLILPNGQMNNEQYIPAILRGRAGYELIYITNETVGRIGYYQLISGKSEKNDCRDAWRKALSDF